MKLHRRTFLAGAAAASMAPRTFAQTTSLFQGGAGGKIIRVTTLSSEGPGSLTEALKTKGKRIVVFEVGGVIDLAGKEIRIDEPFLTIAGQTAPSPGVTLIRGGLLVRADHLKIQHIAVRPGENGQPKKSGWECDGISSYAARDLVVENCSITWATDEGLSASGPRFGPNDNPVKTVEGWRAGTSSHIRFRNNIVAENLSNSTHSKGEHSKGTLIHDNVRDAEISGSLYAHNMERSILLKGGAQGAMRENVVYNPGRRFAHYNLHAGEWGENAFQDGEFAIENNLFLAGPSTDPKAAAFMLGGDAPVKLKMRGNYGRAAKGDALPVFTTFGPKKGTLAAGSSEPALDADEAVARKLMDDILANCGARPWDRDPIDARIIADVKAGTGRIIDSEQDVGGYPVRPETRAKFVEAEWNLATMARRYSAR